MVLDNKQLRFLAILLISATFCISSQSFAQTVAPASPSPAASGSDSFFNTTFWQNVAVAVFSAVLAFLSGFALAGVGKRKGSGKRLSYSLSIEKGLVQVEDNIKQKVQILYNGESIENLYDIQFEFENIGETVVKSQELRFEFPEETKVLDFSFNPQPQPEMKVEKIESGSDLKLHERKCKLGHFERGQKLRVQFIATNRLGIQDVKVYPFNEAGDVELISKSITKEISEKEQVTQFLSFSLLYIIASSAFSIFSVPLGEFMGGLVKLVILLVLVKKIIPFSEILAKAIMRLASDFQRDIGRGVNVQGSFRSGVLVTGDSNQISFSPEQETPDSSSPNN